MASAAHSGVSARSPAEAAGSSAGRRVALGLGAVTLVAVGHAAHDVIGGEALWRAVLSSAAGVAQCAVLTAGHRWTASRRARSLAPGVAGVVVSVGFGLVIVLLHSESAGASWTGVLGEGALVGMGVLGLWSLVYRLPLLRDRAGRAALEAESLRQEAELLRLRVHLHPHFLLNTLNAVAGLVTEDAAGARRLLAALGDLVRDALAEDEELRPFEADLAWLKRYAEVLEARYGELLAFRWEVAPEALSVRLPRLLLQPLVENAVEHGALRRRQGGSVLVSAEVSGGAARFIVEDDGPGFAAGSEEGLGIRLVRRRLALTSPSASLRFEPLDPGTRAVVEVEEAPT